MTNWYDALLKRQQKRDDKKQEAPKKARLSNHKAAVSHDGQGFPSQLERDVYEYQVMRQKSGEIKNLRRQVQVYLTEAKILYKPDYAWELTSNDQTEYGEAKGFETEVWRIKRRLWKHYGPGTLYVYKHAGRSNVALAETISRARKNESSEE